MPKGFLKKDGQKKTFIPRSATGDVDAVAAAMTKKANEMQMDEDTAKRNKYEAGVNLRERQKDLRWYQSMARGAAEGVGSYAGLAGQGAQTAADSSRLIAESMGLPPSDVPPPDYSKIEEQFGEATGIVPAPEGSPEASFQAAGKSAAQFAPFLPLATAGAPAIGVGRGLLGAAELGSAALGGFVQEEVGEENPGMGMLAAMAAGSPVGVGTKAIGTAVSKATDAASAIRKMTQAAEPYKRQLGVTGRALVRGSEEMKRKIDDPALFAEQLRMGEAINVNLPEGAGLRTRQLAEEMQDSAGGGQFSGFDEALSRADPEYNAKAAGQRARTLGEARRRWTELQGEESLSFDDFAQSYLDGEAVAKLEERALWNKVRESDMPRFDLGEIQGAIRETVDAVPEYRDITGNIPKLFEDLMNLNVMDEGGTALVNDMSMNEFQEARSLMLGWMRDAKITPSTENKTRSRLVAPVLDKMNRQIDKWEALDSGGLSAEYAAARASTLANKQLYDLASPVVKILEGGGEAGSLFGAVRRAKGRPGARKTSATEAQRLLTIADKTTGGVASLRKMALDDLFASSAGDFTPGRAKQALGILKKNPAAYRTLLGNQMYDDSLKVLDLARIASVGKAGTSGAVAATGTGIPPMEAIMNVAGQSISPTPGSNVIRAMAGAIPTGFSKNQLMWEKIARTAMEEPRFMRILMEMPTEAALPAWQIGWKQLLRQAGGSTSRRGMQAFVTGGLPIDKK